MNQPMTLEQMLSPTQNNFGVLPEDKRVRRMGAYLLTFSEQTGLLTLQNKNWRVIVDRETLDDTIFRHLKNNGSMRLIWNKRTQKLEAICEYADQACSVEVRDKWLDDLLMNYITTS